MTRQEAITNQKNPIIRKSLERMTDAKYAAHEARMNEVLSSGALDQALDSFFAKKSF